MSAEAHILHTQQRPGMDGITKVNEHRGGDGSNSCHWRNVPKRNGLGDKPDVRKYLGLKYGKQVDM